MPSAVPQAAPPAAAPARRKPLLLHPAAKVLLFVAALLPLAWYVWGAVANTLGANPAEALIRGMGDWTLRFLCLTLAVTPVRQWTNTPALARFRRMLGLFAFFYGCLHFLCYAWLDKDLLLSDILPDIAKRPFILVGTLSLLLMLPLAATSFNRAIKALGAPRWQRLHRLVYVTVLLALLHFFWMRAGKNNFAEVGVYAAIVAVLLGWRVVNALRRKRATA
ncbi:sulfite oxidase heme-binding subunit YedZ [Piscinibacter gummiphilus]|uniref:Protein-methionine-sulfoxide reductase heme-binding subunit MsrQ n=1 Tax=Piscinibacter gummiphilus TaxID=946333 RepID=A0A1W6LFF7_9BURK|nr:protein-methionine-sulfoxide reductase heme-binding subunit MsrQ [Piscinibacter gummiphilus]ARN22918.1 sulfoxide reductase heme-binding subunit YedZ [Piscinibacter gummiphilus]ATU67617.1 sulfoxide reductase heme-binding subunit YedZ [Piscinibacter gummiphilus]GLS96744.1 protein-methionine-sulfoxide reductase heme-binding subunit MsrQ [Piscinibacter gummiphilus]